MTVKYFLLTLIVTFLLTAAQVFAKLGLEKIGGFTIRISSLYTDIVQLISSYYLWLGFLCILISSALWMKVLANVKLSIAYPFISISYVFGLVAAMYIFHETVPFIRWLGVMVLILGLVLISQSP